MCDVTNQRSADPRLSCATQLANAAASLTQVDMDAKGQITVAVGRVCLRFKKVPVAPPPRGHVFVKCAFVGRGGCLFLSGPPVAVGESPAAIGNTAGSSPPPPPLVQSKAVVLPTEEECTTTPVFGVSDGDGGNDDDAAAVAAAAAAHASDPAKVVSVDVGFSLETAAFDLAEPTLSMLENTEIRIDLCLRAGDASETVIGTASVRVSAILRGKNEWTADLALGTYPDSISAGAAMQDKNGTDRVKVAEAVGRDDGAASNLPALGNQDLTLGPLEYGGSTSTMRVTLLTNDDTADFTVGAGSLWTDGAEIMGVPEGWKVVPPPETERSAWNEYIAHRLAGPPRHEYSIWWGAAPASTSNETSEGQDILKAFPAMRLVGGVLRYEPDDELAQAASNAGDSAENTGSQGQAAISTSPREGGRRSSGSTGGGSDSGVGDLTPKTPWNPPAGTWSVRFPCFQTASKFLHRASIRELRRALATPSKGDAGGRERVSSCGPIGGMNTAPTLLPVFVERRELRSEPETEEGKPGGKNAKKSGGGGGGGGKKPAAARKGEAPEPQPRPVEAPWRCRAVIDLSPLARTPDHAAGGEVRGDAGDSPLRAELSAILALEPPTKPVAVTSAAVGASATVGEENKQAQASVGKSPSAEGIGASVSRKRPGDADGNAAERSSVDEVERRIEQMNASETTLLLTFALSRPLVKAMARQETAVSMGDLLVPKDVGPRKPRRDVDAELKQELDAFVLASLEEYAKLFLEPGAEEHSQGLSAEDREKRLFYALNSGGVYHSFLERLKPRVQRVVRKRFGAIPSDAPEAEAFMAELYAHLVEEAAAVLNHRIRNVENEAIPSYITADANPSLDEHVERFGMLARDAEARGAWDEASARHEDRIEAATAAAAALEEWRTLLARSWEEYGLFSLRAGRDRQQRRDRHSRPAAAASGGNSNGSDEGRPSDKDPAAAAAAVGDTLDHAARCLEESLRVYLAGSEESLVAMSVLAAVSMEQGELDRAWVLLENVLEQRLPKLEDGADGYETDELASLVPGRDHALRCVLRDAMGDPAGARRSLFLAMQAYKKGEASGGVGGRVDADEPGAPRRTPVRVMQDTCEWLLELGLPTMARRAFAVAEESERLAVKKAKERGLSTRTPTSLRESSRRLQCHLILAEATATAAEEGRAAPRPPHVGAAVEGGKSKQAGLSAPSEQTKSGIEGGQTADGMSAVGSAPGQSRASAAPAGIVTAHVGVAAAEKLAQEAVELAPGDARPWQALAEACEAQGSAKATEAADAWAAVLDRMEGAWMASSNNGNGSNSSKLSPPPLRLYMRLGALYNTLGRIEEAKACFLRACRAWRAPGPWLGCGVACIRLEQWQEAEDALQHASRLDCNSSLVWGHLALLLLSSGEGRLQEADRALSQAFCLGLADPPLLREIGNAYVAVGRLDAAEDALRKSLAADAGGVCNFGMGGGDPRRSGRGGVGNPHTRRCLADVLSAKNSTSQAVEEYRRFLACPAADVDNSERDEVFARVESLLRKMGRSDELDLLRKEAFTSQQLLTN